MSPKIFILLVLAILVCNIPGMRSQSKGYKYIGCFKDKHTRALEKNIGKLGKVSDCVDRCRNLKLKYAGLQYGGYCFCGNKHDKYGKASKCNRKCKSGEICGGSWANSVFEVQTQKIDLRMPTKYVGCVKAYFIGTNAGPAISVQHCINKCRRFGMPYAGISIKSCYCTKDYSKFPKSTNCQKTCIRDGKECGGNGLFSVYEVPKYPDGYIQKGHIGCYKENLKNKVMKTSMGESFGVGHCTWMCRYATMKYAGLRDGVFCHCGNEYAKYGKASDCNKKCVSGEPCGGTSSNSVYEVLAPFEGQVHVGCFKEGETRILSKKMNTVFLLSQCFEKCFDYNYFGIEKKNVCYCGNDYPKTAADGQCTMKCYDKKPCGGNAAISVYKVQLDLPPN